MKKIVKATALSLALAFASSAAMAAENIAFINTGALFQNHPERAAIVEKLNKDFKPQVDQLAESKKKIEGKIAALNKEAKNLRSADIKKREDEINKLMKEHDEKAAKFQQQVQQIESEEDTKLLASIQTAANNIAKEKGYTYVIDANTVVFAVEGKDITEEVFKAIGGKLPEPKAEKAAEPAKAK